MAWLLQCCCGRCCAGPFCQLPLSSTPPLQTSGNDIFFRNPFNVEENLFVDVSSPSSSRFESVADLGSPNDAAQRTLDQARVPGCCCAGHVLLRRRRCAAAVSLPAVAHAFVLPVRRDWTACVNPAAWHNVQHASLTAS